MILHFLVAEPHYPNAACFQKRSTFRVILDMRWVSMNATIYLDLGLIFHAEGVENKPVVGMLSPELQARQMTAAQCLP